MREAPERALAPPDDPGATTAPRRVSFGEATRVWAYIGLASFGGPAAQIALMHRELVERRRWISEPRFMHALSYCMLLPGPEAQQLAIYIGWLMHRTRGGLVAGILFVLPGFFTVLALSALYAAFREVPQVAALFFGLKAAILAGVVEAVIRIGKRALPTRALYAAAAAAFLALYLFHVPFPLIVAGAALAGLVGATRWPGAFTRPPGATVGEAGSYVVDDLLRRGELEHTRPSLRRALVVLVVSLGLWAAPPAALALALGRDHVLVQESVFFGEAAVVTFGGAYAVLAFVAQRAVETYGWLRPGEMIDGLGLAETTPGPLILVVEFVGFMGAYRSPGGWPPVVSGVAGALVTVWSTFVPCFLWIFVGAPWVEALRASRALHAALTVVMAAVVGVILNLSVWFFLHAAFARTEERHAGPLTVTLPAWGTVDVAMVALAAGAMVALVRFRVGMGKTLAVSALLGAAWRLWS